MHTRLSLSVALLALAVFAAAVPARDASSGDLISLPDEFNKPAQKVPAQGQTGPEQKKTATEKKADRKASSDAKKKLGTALKSGDVKADGLYEMSSDELAMDCKRMTGSMKITISRLRDAATRKGGSSLAESSHKTLPSLIGGSTASADRQATLARERAKLDAYNRQLAARNCKPLDVDAELARAADAPTKY